MTQKRWLIVLAILVLLAAAGWWRFGHGPQVAAAAAKRGTAVEIVYATGGVEPVRWAKVASLVRDRIVDMCDCEGKAVKKGDVLARLDDREVTAQLQDLKAREEFLKREMSRVSELITRGAATTQAYERASMDLSQVQAQITVQDAKINDYIIVAPMDGVVLRRDGEIGEIAEAGQILFPRRRAQAAASGGRGQRRGHPARHRRADRAVPHRRLSRPAAQGKVSEITPMGDVAAKTFRVKMLLPDDTPLKPGMSVEANIVTREKPNALLVPADAVQGNAVFVIDGSTRAQARGQDRHPRHPHGRGALRPRRRRARRVARADRSQGRRARARHRRRGR